MWRGFSPKTFFYFLYELSKRKYILLVDRKKCGEGSLRNLLLFSFMNCQKENIFCWWIEKNVARVLSENLLLFSFMNCQKENIFCWWIEKMWRGFSGEPIPQNFFQPPSAASKFFLYDN